MQTLKQQTHMNSLQSQKAVVIIIEIPIGESSKPLITQILYQTVCDLILFPRGLLLTHALLLCNVLKFMSRDLLS